MKQELNTNTLVNDIMSGGNNAVMLFAAAGTGKTDFLTELASRYRKVFWFNSLLDDIEIYCDVLIDTILVDAPDLKKKLKQLMYCEWEFNGPGVIITALLDYISTIKGDCLMVFERAEALYGVFDLAPIERIIKFCPSNLKVVVSGDRFVNFDYGKFEPNYPKLIDETILLPKTDKPDVEGYLSDLSDSDRAVLCYVRQLMSFEADFVDRLAPGIGNVLRYLDRKGCYVTSRDGRRYRFNTLLKTYLDEHHVALLKALPFPAADDVIRQYGDYLMEQGQYFGALRLYHKSSDALEALDRCCKALLADNELTLRMERYVSPMHVPLYPGNYADYPYYSIYAANCLACDRKFEEAEPLLLRAIEQLEDRDCSAYFKACALRLKWLADRDETEQLRTLYAELLSKYAETEPYRMTVLTASYGNVISKLDRSISEIEKMVSQIEKDDIFYVRLLENIAEGYFEQGNYKRSISIVKGIKEAIPQYVIPHRLLIFNYYAGEVDETEKMARRALRFAKDNDIHKDISMLYAILGAIELYHGRVDEAKANYETAFRTAEKGSAGFYYATVLRCKLFANHFDPVYAREMAHIYLKNAEAFDPFHVKDMSMALAYCYYKLDEKEKAYQYATRCIQLSNAKSVLWLNSMAIAVDYMLNKGDLKRAPTLIGNLLKASAKYGMRTVIVEEMDGVYRSIVRYAEEHEIESEYLAEIKEAYRIRRDSQKRKSRLNIGFFGDVSITADGKEIQWKTRKSKELFLHYLLVGESGLDRNVIIDYLWKDYLYESAINNLKTTNNIIRKTLEKYGIEFKLEYVNSRYILKIEDLDCDLDRFKALSRKMDQENSVGAMVATMNEMLKIYRNDFATDINYREFDNERKILRQGIIIQLLRLVRALAKEGEYIEAKRFLSALIVIDKQNDYTHFVEELDSHINIT